MAGLLFLVAHVSAADWTVYKGDSITIQDANSTITWGKDYTWNATGTMTYTDAFEINMTNTADRNISITLNTTADVNATLWEYKLTPLNLGNTVIKLEVAAVPGSKVDVSFTGLSSPGSNQYKLTGGKSKTYNTGGEVAWSHSNWNQDHNFTLTYGKPSSSGGTGGSGTGGGGSIPDDDLTTGPISDKASWINTQWKQFNFRNIDSRVGVEEVVVKMEQNTSGLQIGVTRHRGKPSDVPGAPNSYRYYEFLTDASDTEIDSTTVRLRVDRSWAQQYRKVVIARLENNQWNELPTTLVEKNGGKWTYEASATGFSYYTVLGKGAGDQDQQDDTTDQDQTDTGENQTQDQQQQDQEPDNQTTSGDGEQREKRELPIQALAIVAAALLVLAVTGFFGYRYWNRHQIETRLEELAEEVRQEIEYHDIENPEEVYQKLDDAEKALDNNDYDGVERLLRQVERELEGRETWRTDRD